MNIGKAFGIMALVTILSRLSGFFRVAVFAAYFGGGVDADIFLSVMIVPELMYRFLADGLISSAAVPMFVRARENRDDSRRIFWSLFWGITAFSLPLIFLLEWFAEPICGALVPGFIPQSMARLVVLWRWVIPYVFFALQSALITAFLNAHGEFGYPTAGPILVNITIILGIIVAAGDKVETLGAWVLASIFIQFLWMGWRASRNGLEFLSPFKRENFDATRLGEFFIQSLPILCWISLSAVVPLFERYLLSSQREGSVAILTYTDKIMFLPLGIISMSLATAVFPRLSQESGPEGEKLLEKALWGMVTFIVPVGLILASGAGQVVDIIYRRGQFGVTEVRLTGELLQIYSQALLLISASFLLNRLFFAAGDFKIPFLAGLFSILMQTWVDSILVSRLGSVGVGWGALVGSLLQTLLLLCGAMIRRGRPFAWNCLLPVALGLGVIVAGQKPLGVFLFWSSHFFPPTKLALLLILGISWGIVQVVCLGLFRKRLGHALRD